MSQKPHHIQQGSNFPLRTERDLLWNTLADCWSKETKSFDPQRFFKQWFRTKGIPIFFLFKKNLSHSNIQFAELLALIRTHLQSKENGASARDIQFVTFSEFIDGFSLMAEAFKGASSVAACDSIYKLYGEALKRLVVVEPLFGSATAYIPPHRNLDERLVCGESGYIHSCGTNVSSSPIDQTNPEELLDAIENHINTLTNGNKTKIFFTVYAHEDFSDYDRYLASELRGGLDDVKVYVEKYNVGSNTLVQFLKRLKERLKDKVIIPEPGDFRRQHGIARETPGVDKTRTVWLIIDRGVSNTIQTPDRERFLVCYDQTIHNGNPFHLFDENKPAWVSHTTLPHTLAAAMINITRPWSKNEGQNFTRIGDPFGGTGTVWFEALKIKEAEAESSDYEEIASLLVTDNLSFFSAHSAVLKKHFQELNEVLSILKSPAVNSKKAKRFKSSPKVRADFEWMAKIFPDLIDDQLASGEVISPIIKSKIEGQDTFRRLLVYIALRTRIRHISEFHRGSSNENIAYAKETKVLLSQLESLIKQRIREEKGAKALRNLHIFQGSYSQSCGVSRNVLLKKLRPRSLRLSITHQEAERLPRNYYDIIVTDPPYGFNTEESHSMLAEVYARSLRSIVRSLRDNGQLVICLPEKSHTGKKIPAFTKSGFVTQQVLTEAELINKEVIVTAQSVPKPAAIFRPPFYWESERFLRRIILHFRFRNLSRRKKRLLNKSVNKGSL